MPELERLMLHRLAELDALVRQAYAEFDYKRIFAQLNAFMTSDLSAFYFDIRKDALYCDPVSSAKRKACLTVLDQMFRCTVTWLAPMLCFTAEEAWLSRYGDDAPSVHLQTFPEDAGRVARRRAGREMAQGAARAPRRHRRARTRARAEAHRLLARSGARRFMSPTRICSPRSLTSISPKSASPRRATLVEGEGPADAFRLDEVRGVAVVPKLAHGKKCARSWKMLESVGADPDYPDVSPRDAQALREWEAMRKAAE